MSDKVFANGLRVSRNNNAPDFVLCSVSVKLDDFIEWMKEHQENGWVNLSLKQSQKGNYYAELDKWKPSKPEKNDSRLATDNQFGNPKASETREEDDIPF